jgi:hypothetical protein
MNGNTEDEIRTMINDAEEVGDATAPQRRQTNRVC